MLEEGPQKIFSIDSVDLCAYLSGKLKLNLNAFVKIFMKMAKEMFPNYFHKCPYVGLHTTTNFTVEKKYITFAPTGTYKVFGNVTDGKKDLFWYYHEYTLS
jgi:hypothetical protein